MKKDNRGFHIIDLLPLIFLGGIVLFVGSCTFDAIKEGRQEKRAKKEKQIQKDTAIDAAVTAGLTKEDAEQSIATPTIRGNDQKSADCLTAIFNSLNAADKALINKNGYQLAAIKEGKNASSLIIVRGNEIRINTDILGMHENGTPVTQEFLQAAVKQAVADIRSIREKLTATGKSDEIYLNIGRNGERWSMLDLSAPRRTWNTAPVLQP